VGWTGGSSQAQESDPAEASAARGRRRVEAKTRSAPIGGECLSEKDSQQANGCPAVKRMMLDRGSEQLGVGKCGLGKRLSDAVRLCCVYQRNLRPWPTLGWLSIPGLGCCTTSLQRPGTDNSCNTTAVICRLSRTLIKVGIAPSRRDLAHPHPPYQSCGKSTRGQTTNAWIAIWQTHVELNARHCIMILADIHC
jgi:hypothetical protein